MVPEDQKKGTEKKAKRMGQSEDCVPIINGCVCRGGRGRGGEGGSRSTGLGGGRGGRKKGMHKSEMGLSGIGLVRKT